MSRLFIEGFETGKCSPLWYDPPADPSLGSLSGFSGSYYCSPYANSGTIRLSPTEAEIYLAFKHYINFQSSENGMWYFKDSGGTTILSITRDGVYPNRTLNIRRGISNGTIIDSYAFTEGFTRLFEVRYKPLNTGGIVQVKMDGVQVINFSGDSTNGLENIQDVIFGGTSGQHGYYDDIVLDDADWIGNTRIQKLQISGAGTTSEWDASAGNPEDCIDELPYSDSDWVETNVVNESLTCACADMTGNVNSVKCVEIYGRGQYEGSPTPTKQKIAIRVNGSEYYGDDKSPGLSFAGFGKRWELNPDDAAAWEEADINAIEIGVRSVT